MQEIATKGVCTPQAAEPCKKAAESSPPPLLEKFSNQSSTEEVWKDIAGFEGHYQVSSFARVRRLPFDARTRGNGVRHYDKKIVSVHVMYNGYLFVVLHIRGTKRSKSCFLHRLVAQAFIPNPDNLPEVNHKNEIKTDNRIDNLEWCSRDYNCQYGTRQERSCATQGVKRREVLCVETNTVYRSFKEAGKCTGIIANSIRNVCLGKKYCRTAGGYHWKFINN